MARTFTGDPIVNRVEERVQATRLWWAGPVTAVAAALGAVVVREVGVLVGATSPGLQIMQEAVVAFGTIALVLVGTLVFAGIIRVARMPVRTFRVVALVTLVLSMLSPIAAGAGWTPLGVTPGLGEVLSMMAMHVVAGAAAILLLPALARAK